MSESPLRDAFDAVHAPKSLKAGTKSLLAREAGRCSKGRMLRPPHARLAACALCAVLVAGASFAAWRAPSALVSVDVNPSIELTLNRFDHVLSARAYNADGADILTGVPLAGRTLDRALAALLGESGLRDYLTTPDAVLAVAVSADSTARQQTLLDQAESAARAAVVGARVECHAVDSAIARQAHEHGLSAGKYCVIRDLQQVDPSATVDAYRDSTVEALRERIDACHSATPGSFCEDGCGGSQHGSGMHHHAHGHS